MKTSLMLTILVLVCGNLALATTPGLALPFPPASADAKGFLGVIAVSANALAAKLPKELKLAPEYMLPNGTYPVNMFIGEHKNFNIEIDGHNVSVAKAYGEATLSITVVGPKDPTKRYIYTPSIIVDSVPAMVLGWSLGFPKRLAHILAQDNTFHAQFLEDQPVINLVFESATDVDQGAFQKNLNFLKANMHQIIGRTAFGWTCYDFDWGFADGSFEPINTKIKLFAAFAGKALVGDYPSVQLDKASMGLGGMKVSTHWKMSNYSRCQ